MEINDSKRKVDNVLDNGFNMNEIIFKQLPDIQIEASYKSRNPEIEDAYEYIRIQELEILIESEFKAKRKKHKRLNREHTLEFFYELYRKLDLNYYNEVEFFVAFCEIGEIKMRDFYALMLPKMKSKIMNILAENTGSKLLNRTKFFKLF